MTETQEPSKGETQEEGHILQIRVIPAHMVKESYGCPFCKKVSVQRSTMNRHVGICYANPNRDCETCGNEGVEFIHSLGANMGVIFDADSKDCSSCLIAKERGGKSYIQSLPNTTKEG